MRLRVPRLGSLQHSTRARSWRGGEGPLKLRIPGSFFTARCYASAVYVVMQCPSVTFVDHVKTNKHIFEFFSPSGIDTILVFHTKGGVDIPTGTPPP